MRNRQPDGLGFVSKLCLLIFGFLATAAVQAAQFTLYVVDNDGNPVNGFRWILQEDTTFPVDPNDPATTADELLAMGFHASYHPIAKDIDGVGLTGNSDTDNVNINAPNGRYYASVLPYSGYSISGQPVQIGMGNQADDVTVVVQKHPIPTATITLMLFHDNFPVNGMPDLPEESSPSFLPSAVGPIPIDWTQFNILVEEPAGRYGIAGGQVIQDAYGNPLGTSYVKGCDADGQPDFDINTNYGCFDLDGNAIVAILGDGTLAPDENGLLTVRNLAPGKYGIVAIPPTGENWQQSSTIEGTKVIDAWVKANEPPFFVEFGPPGPHVFIGFVKSTLDGGFDALPAGGATLSGTITDMHLSRSPATQMYSGRPFPGCWVALNEGTAGAVGAGLYAAPCADDSSFDIADVAPGDYQLKVFDANLDVVIATLGLTVDANGVDCNVDPVTGIAANPGCDFGPDIGVFNWFARLNTGVFKDDDQDGFWDGGELGLGNGEIGIGPESQDVTLRWRDGTIYQNFPTDNDGLAPFDEVFPFFHWLVAEVSFANKKATGATFVVDAGGEIPGKGTSPSLPTYGGIEGFPDFGEMTPQAQSENGGLPYRTEVGQVLTTGFQGFLGQTSVMQFGKVDYVSFDFSSTPPTYVGENGGISGIVYYATTRAENEPQLAAAEEWEAGVPRVQLALYADGDIDSFPLGDFPDGDGDVDWNGDDIRDLDDDVIDDINGDGVVTLADVDNYPFGWSEGGTMGPEDVENSGTDGDFDLGDALQVTWTDSWDDSLPTDCQGQNNTPASTIVPAITDDRCFDGLRNFNQVRPGVFDGGYAFADYDMVHLTLFQPEAAMAIQDFYDAITDPDTGVPDSDKLQLGLIPGDYIVESTTPPGYKLMKEEDKNVDFGDEYIPSPAALAATCVGVVRDVPPYLSMTTKDGSGALDQLIDGIAPADAGAPFAGDPRPLCDLKKVPLSAGQNAAAEFFVMTDVPVVGNITGFMLNDLANEFNSNSPSFGEKFAPPLLPVAFYDWNGKLVNRVYGDVYGRYNLVVPSSYTANLPQPSGMSPNMLVSCMNDAGPIPDGSGGLMLDPFFDPQYSQFCYTFQYMPGTVTYLDTPVVPIASFTTPGAFPVDCERPTHTPMIRLVTRTDDTGPFVVPGDQIRIESMGAVDVPNPEWDGVNLNQKNISRNYSFSPNLGNVFLEDAAGNRVALNPANNQWSQGTITADVPDPFPEGDYQVVVVNGDGTESAIGVTLTVGTEIDVVHRVTPAPYPATPIQDAIDAAAPGALILVAPGSYDELVVMSQPVKLQGWGAGAVFLNARQVPTEKIIDWRSKVATLVGDGSIDQLPGQALGIAGFPALDEVLFPTEEGAGIFVVGKNPASTPGNPQNFSNQNARIDGFTIVGASTGGGIVVNGYNEGLSIGNNRLTANSGVFGGGIRVGHPQLSHETVGGDIVYDDALNDDVRIHHNHVAKNGGLGGAGGGLSLHTGADAYKVQENWICGNFTQGDGAGIGHLGVSDGGLIEDNYVIFNESFAQAGPQSGGGIFVGGQAPLMGAVVTPGSGSVTIDANVIRGNLAGAGDGGGIRVSNANGQDVADNPVDSTQWYQVEVFNNMITNNVAGLAGGGISLQDALRVSIRNNTVANNESTSTTAEAFTPGVPNVTTALPAGIVSRLHSDGLAALVLTDFSDPELRDNIVYQNRSFYWTNFDDPDTLDFIETGLVPATCLDPTDPLNDPTCDVAMVIVDDYSVDLAVLDGRIVQLELLDPQFSLLTDTAGYDVSNITGDPAFVNGYFNGARDNLNIPEFTTLQTAGAFDEGGNFIQVTFGPLSLVEPDTNPNNPEGELYDYHLVTGSFAIDEGGVTPATGRLSVDIDNDLRPAAAGPDIGADEAQ